MPRYFSYGLRSTDVSDVAVDRLLGLLSQVQAEGSPEAIEREALTAQLLDDATVDRFVMHLRKTELVISPQAAEALLLLLAAAAHRLTDRGGGGFGIATNPFDQGAILLTSLLKQVESNQRLEIARAVAAASEPLSFAVEFIQWLRPSAEGVTDALTEQEVASLARTVADRIKAAASGPPAVPVVDLDPRRPLRLVQVWLYSGDADACKSHLDAVVEAEPAVLARLVEAVLPNSYDLYSGERRTSELGRETYDFLLTLLQPAVLLRGFERLSGCDLSAAPPTDLRLDCLPRAEQHALRFAHLHYSRVPEADHDEGPTAEE